MTPKERARLIAETMLSREGTGPAWGVEIEDIDEGYARISMTLRADMLNGHGIAHGGMLFSLADTAFAYACNSYNHRAVASGVDINFVAPVQLGDILTAHGHARQQGGRNGVYDIEVTNPDGQTAALPFNPPPQVRVKSTPLVQPVLHTPGG